MSHYGNNWTVTVDLTPYNYTGTNVNIFRFNSTTNPSFKIDFNGGNTFTGGTNPLQINANPNSRLGMGIYTDFYQGEIKEVIVFDRAISDEEVIKINYYLSKKWDLGTTVDSDNDNFVDANDAFPLDNSESLDTDSDGIGNNADTDDDGDGYSDAIETVAGTSPIDATDFPKVDLSDQVDAQIGVTSGLDTIEANLKLWLDASNIDATGNITLTDGDAIGEWIDLSGSGNNAMQTNSNLEPTINLTESKLIFDGVNDFVRVPFNDSIKIENNLSHYIFMVYKTHKRTNISNKYIWKL